jgi:hypothetical protein
MAIPARLKNHLEQSHTPFNLVTHEPARSSQYAAEILTFPGRRWPRL